MTFEHGSPMVAFCPLPISNEIKQSTIHCSFYPMKHNTNTQPTNYSTNQPLNQHKHSTQTLNQLLNTNTQHNQSHQQRRRNERRHLRRQETLPQPPHRRRRRQRRQLGNHPLLRQNGRTPTLPRRHRPHQRQERPGHRLHRPLRRQLRQRLGQNEQGREEEPPSPTGRCGHGHELRRCALRKEDPHPPTRRYHRGCVRQPL